MSSQTNNATEWNTRTIEGIENMRDLKRLVFTIGGQMEDWVEVNKMNWAAVKALSTLSEVHFVLEEAPCTPMEEEELPEVYRMLDNIISEIGDKSVSVEGMDIRYIDTVLKHENVKVFQRAEEFSQIAPYLNNQRVFFSIPVLEGNVNDILKSGILASNLVKSVRLDWEEDDEEKAASLATTIDLSPYVQLKSITLGSLDVKCEWKMPVSVTELDIKYEKVINMGELTLLESLTGSSVPTCVLPKLKTLSLFQPQEIDVEALRHLPALEELSINYSRAASIDVSNTPLKCLRVRNCKCVSLSLPSNVLKFEAISSSFEVLECPASLQELVLNGADELKSLSFLGNNLNTVVLMRCNKLEPFDLPQSVETVKMMIKDRQLIKNLPFFEQKQVFN